MASSERWEGHTLLPSGWEERIPDLVARLRRSGAGLVYVFGSAARGEDEPRPPPRDLDLAVWGMEEDPWSVRADLEDILATDRLDLVRLEEADPELRFAVVARGRLLFSRDTELENGFETKVLREYRDLAPFRRVQMEHVRRRHGLDGP